MHSADPQSTYHLLTDLWTSGVRDIINFSFGARPSSSIIVTLREEACEMAGVLLLIVLTLMYGPPAIGGREFSPSAVEKGVFLVASPTLNDPNFSQTVVLILEHGAEGTLGVILNRSTNTLLSEALPGVAALKGTSYRLFSGGPVQPNVVLLLSRLKEPQPDMRTVFDSVYVGGTPDVLERILQAGPRVKFRAFAGYAGWAPGQLGFEMLQGAWAVLPPEGNLFDKDPASLWPDSLARLQAPRVISYERDRRNIQKR